MTIKKDKPLISVVMGSKSDLEIMDKAANILRDMMVPFELDIVSAHRTPRKMFDFAELQDLLEEQEETQQELVEKSEDNTED